MSASIVENDDMADDMVVDPTQRIYLQEFWLGDAVGVDVKTRDDIGRLNC
jgi:hypothetical protein